ncbi:hypothetical protein TNCT_166071 [Trichonephila clavata]|uniref:Uncharacterized protein n=1 Tax=Trichonephila clavata TaxID=2740835 RepID=A0A8X6L9T6_TRICU|nr:hypothetical protein TNCT_166071 [Trichonephila clavata]
MQFEVLFMFWFVCPIPNTNESHSRKPQAAQLCKLAIGGGSPHFLLLRRPDSPSIDRGFPEKPALCADRSPLFPLTQHAALRLLLPAASCAFLARDVVVRVRLPACMCFGAPHI